jgi:glutamine amidotransferase
MIVIIDYKMGNVGSILNMLKKIGASAKISADPQDIEAANRLILPGVGAFDQGMANLADSGLIPLLNRRVLEEQCPILGICLGMQLMSKRSEEGTRDGLGWMEAETRRFKFEQSQSQLKIPHMGWNTVNPLDRSGLFAGFEEPPRFYFVHSYHVCCADPGDVLGTTTYGYEFTSAVRKNNILGTQFHPEKSHKFGMRLLHNYSQMS